ncbi:YjbF family lipoprotein [Buttiauxella agrestis]|uniref:YjbF family outer membrane lipoprotein n=1 Tax=Buttiauxella agrestis ATCC 33320 TaxID=1006004 RepID=A0A085GLT2_9ENTR|nr:YjbF family lipoprotein [Buttiauxella agrestis]KFC84677.1 YjbF family outer membrane lipoprotein [Buttiauxella agrestis ATCC 33320]
MQRLVILLSCLLLQACSDTTKGLGSSLWHSMVGDDGIQLTHDEIQNMRYASQYMRINNGPQIFVVLAFDENGQQKWVTQDRSMIVTEHSRIVKTTGLGDNLQQVTNLANDPLTNPNQIIDGASWTRQMAWTERQQVRMATARSTFTWDGTDTLKVAMSTTPVRVLDEEITADGKTWHNRFWVDSEGHIRQSKQYLGPDYWPVNTILLKAAKE